MLLLTTRKSTPTVKPCCGGCASAPPGNQCCGKKKSPLPAGPRFEQRGGILLPRRQLIQPRQPFSPRSLLGYPPEPEWGGRFRPWSPAWMPQIDMSECPCCGPSCCEFVDCPDTPDIVTVSVVAASGNCSGALGASWPLPRDPVDTNRWIDTTTELGNMRFECEQLAGNPCGDSETFCRWKLHIDNPCLNTVMPCGSPSNSHLCACFDPVFCNFDGLTTGALTRITFLNCGGLCSGSSGGTMTLQVAA